MLFDVFSACANTFGKESGVLEMRSPGLLSGSDLLRDLDAADQDAISGRVELANILGGAFGVSDSESRFEAISS